MINLATTGKLQVITGAAGAVDVYSSWVDLSGTTVTPGSLPFAITTASTNDVVPAPAAGVRNVKSCFVRNKSGVTIPVTVQVNISAVAYEIKKTSLPPGAILYYEEGCSPWAVYQEGTNFRSIAVADQSVPVALTLVNGTVLDATNMRVGTMFKWRIAMSKTAAGVAAQTFDVRFGTAGTTADTARLTGYTTGTQTAVADVAEVELDVTIRSISASGTAHGLFELVHNLAATGFAPTPNVVMQATSGAFDTTLANLRASISTTPGAAAVTTIHQVEAERLDP